MLEYEMLVSHSPPVFSHSPANSFLSNYQKCRFNSESFSIMQNGTCRQLQHSLSFNNYKPASSTFLKPKSPKRPCLVIRPNDESSNTSDEDPTSPTRLKKKVVFADDKGMSLTHVRVMTEPSNVPPLWSTRFLDEVTKGVNAEPEALKEPWEITFPQPASDYVTFRKKLDVDNVSLENVIIKEADDQVIGTVKVKNLSFHKEVRVRWTSDMWKTHEDAFCNFVPNNANSTVSSAYIVYDTFSFKINLPPKSRQIEFCVCFTCEGHEYWDSNNGKNYIILKKALAPLYKSLSNDDFYRCVGNMEKNEQSNTIGNTAGAKRDYWSEYASWNHLENNTPYW